MLSLLVRSGIYGVFSKSILSLSQIFIMPLLLLLYGKSEFGVLLTILSLNAFLALSSFGITKSMQNKISGFVGMANEGGLTENELFYSFWFVFKRAGLLFLMLYAFSLYFSEIKAYSFLVLLFFISGFCQILLNVFMDMYRGIGRPDVPNKYQVVLNLSTVLSASISVLLELSINSFFFFAYVTPYLIALIYQLTKHIHIFRKPTQYSTVVFDNAAKAFLFLMLIQFFGFGLDTFMIASFLGSEAAAEYGVVLRFYNFILFGFTVFTSSSWPLMRRLLAGNDKTAFFKLFRKLNIFLIVYATISSLLLVTTIPKLIAIFFPGFEKIDLFFFVFISLQLIVVLMTSLIIPLMNALNILREQILFGVLNVISNILITMLLFDEFGIIAAPIGTFISNLLFGVLPLGFLLRARLSCNVVEI